MLRWLPLVLLFGCKAFPEAADAQVDPEGDEGVEEMDAGPDTDGGRPPDAGPAVADVATTPDEGESLPADEGCPEPVFDYREAEAPMQEPGSVQGAPDITPTLDNFAVVWTSTPDPGAPADLVFAFHTREGLAGAPWTYGRAPDRDPRPQIAWGPARDQEPARIGISWSGEGKHHLIYSDSLGNITEHPQGVDLPHAREQRAHALVATPSQFRLAEVFGDAHAHRFVRFPGLEATFGTCSYLRDGGGDVVAAAARDEDTITVANLSTVRNGELDTLGIYVHLGAGCNMLGLDLGVVGHVLAADVSWAPAWNAWALTYIDEAGAWLLEVDARGETRGEPIQILADENLEGIALAGSPKEVAVAVAGRDLTLYRFDEHRRPLPPIEIAQDARDPAIAWSIDTYGLAWVEGDGVKLGFAPFGCPR